MAVKTTLAYKVFRRRRIGEDEGVATCGHPGCTKHRSKPKTQFLLYGRSTGDTSLQKAGDKGSVEGNLSLCSRGWHAIRARYLQSYISWEQWRDKSMVVFVVQLSGDIIEDENKLCARHIEMIREVPYSSAEGRALRKKIEDLSKQAEVRRVARRRLLAARWHLAQKKKREAARLRRAQRRKIAAVLRKLKSKQAKERAALLKKLRGKP